MPQIINKFLVSLQRVKGGEGEEATGKGFGGGYAWGTLQTQLWWVV